jgi:hypothetical protein
MTLATIGADVARLEAEQKRIERELIRFDKPPGSVRWSELE